MFSNSNHLDSILITPRTRLFVDLAAIFIIKRDHEFKFRLVNPRSQLQFFYIMGKRLGKAFRRGTLANVIVSILTPPWSPSSIFLFLSESVAPSGFLSGLTVAESTRDPYSVERYLEAKSRSVSRL